LSRIARLRAIGWLVLLTSAPAFCVSGAVTTRQPDNSSPAIVIGFVGGFVRHDAAKHGPVELAQRLQSQQPKDSSYIEVFENRHRKQAYETILRLLDTDHDGTLSSREKQSARIILYGHSWGASAAVLLARDLDRAGIPVLLTVQVDSVAKLWQNDSIIPDNVAEAVNFYQPHGIVHGRERIVAADPSKTEILGNYKFDYRKDPVACAENSWYDRFFTPGHAQSECDPHVWSKIEQMVKQRVAPQARMVSAAPLPLTSRAFKQNVVDEPGVADKGGDRR
jgi:pimeloyl-ACP methyl ester carboxylesterase